ncbi:DUF4253 domain-containing protein [Streptomyces sp. NPDC002671]
MATLPNPLLKLATDPSGRSLGLQLPPGRLIEALLWHSGKQAAPGAWKAVAGTAARVGLVPVLLDVGRDLGPVENWELIPEEMSYPGDHDVEEVLAEYWEEETEDEELDSLIEPFGPDWPGLAPAPVLTADPDTRAAQVADSLTGGSLPRLADPRVALIPARRSADIPAAIGWAGALNYDNDVAPLCAILRSWEDRFGIRVVALSFDTLTVSVAAPPATQEEAEAVAAEHFAFCPDNLLQNGPDRLRAYAKKLIGEPLWSFWWD